MDVVVLSQYGIQYVIVVFGIVIIQDYMIMLMCGMQEIVCCYDGDWVG